MGIYTHRFIRLGLLVSCALLVACTVEQTKTLITIADARQSPATFTDIGEQGDSVGDVLTFDQPLLDQQMKVIGNNSGSCIRTLVGKSFQCQWTLTVADGSIQVAGREADKGSSMLSIVGGTGRYAGISGEMESVNNNNGTFTQTLRYRLQ